MSPTAPRAKLRPLRDEIADLPNLITLGRIALIPAVLAFTARGGPGMAIAACSLFLLAAATDWLDGWLARRMGLVTVVGKFLDPLADKLIVLSTLVILVGADRAPAWLTVLLMSRELAVTGLRAIASQEGLVIAAGTSGKIKTVMQLAGIALLLAHCPIGSARSVDAAGRRGSSCTKSLVMSLCRRSSTSRCSPTPPRRAGVPRGRGHHPRRKAQNSPPAPPASVGPSARAAGPSAANKRAARADASACPRPAPRQAAGANRDRGRDRLAARLARCRGRITLLDGASDADGKGGASFVAGPRRCARGEDPRAPRCRRHPRPRVARFVDHDRRRLPRRAQRRQLALAAGEPVPRVIGWFGCRARRRDRRRSTRRARRDADDGVPDLWLAACGAVARPMRAAPGSRSSAAIRRPRLARGPPRR